MLDDNTMDYIGNQDTDTHRVCGSCGKLKPVSDFYKDGVDSKGKVRYRRDCKECYKNTRFIELQMKSKGRLKTNG